MGKLRVLGEYRQKRSRNRNRAMEVKNDQRTDLWVERDEQRGVGGEVGWVSGLGRSQVGLGME